MHNHMSGRRFRKTEIFCLTICGYKSRARIIYITKFLRAGCFSFSQHFLEKRSMRELLERSTGISRCYLLLPFAFPCPHSVWWKHFPAVCHQRIMRPLEEVKMTNFGNQIIISDLCLQGLHKSPCFLESGFTLFTSLNSQKIIIMDSNSNCNPLVKVLTSAILTF